ncbi:MAG: GlsB/YeaQ/YmgE family stress response membrane protein [Anaerolineae bacterium]|jgi:uncharacterized membrane protein YeaQ/YmgE (transglycosylase-associated protein family)|nr:GlsB/YeaQ/YmgE family stress response membrane protein [Anaerolineae bacterium]
MNIEIGSVIVWLIIGSLAGMLAGFILRGRGYGPVGNLVIGLVGALLGGFIFRVLNIRITGLPTFTFNLADLVVAFIGAVVLILILRLLLRR